VGVRVGGLGCGARGWGVGGGEQGKFVGGGDGVWVGWVGGRGGGWVRLIGTPAFLFLWGDLPGLRGGGVCGLSRGHAK